MAWKWHIFSEHSLSADLQRQCTKRRRAGRPLRREELSESVFFINRVIVPIFTKKTPKYCKNKISVYKGAEIYEADGFYRSSSILPQSLTVRCNTFSMLFIADKTWLGVAHPDLRGQMFTLH